MNQSDRIQISAEVPALLLESNGRSRPLRPDDCATGRAHKPFSASAKAALLLPAHRQARSAAILPGRSGSRLFLVKGKNRIGFLECPTREPQVHDLRDHAWPNLASFCQGTRNRATVPVPIKFPQWSGHSQKLGHTRHAAGSDGRLPAAVLCRFRVLRAAPSKWMARPESSLLSSSLGSCVYFSCYGYLSWLAVPAVPESVWRRAEGDGHLGLRRTIVINPVRHGCLKKPGLFDSGKNLPSRSGRSDADLGSPSMLIGLLAPACKPGQPLGRHARQPGAAPAGAGTCWFLAPKRRIGLVSAILVTGRHRLGK